MSQKYLLRNRKTGEMVPRHLWEFLCTPSDKIIVSTKTEDLRTWKDVENWNNLYDLIPQGYVPVSAVREMLESYRPGPEAEYDRYDLVLNKLLDMMLAELQQLAAAYGVKEDGE